MSSPKKIGRWNRFEIAFNEGNWPKPSFGSSAPSRTSEKTRTLRKMKKTPGPTTASSEETSRKGNETPGKIPLIGATRPEETLFSESPSSEETPRKGNETPGKASSSPENKTPIKLTSAVAPSVETTRGNVAPSAETLGEEVAAPEKTPTEPSTEKKKSQGNAASLEETLFGAAAPSEETPMGASTEEKASFLFAAASPSLWAEARQGATKARKRRF